MDDIKSMIKSRRDERYHGSAFEKRDPRIDENREKVAIHNDDSRTQLIAAFDQGHNRSRQVPSDLNPGREDPRINEQQSRQNIVTGREDYAQTLNKLCEELKYLASKISDNELRGLASIHGNEDVDPDAIRGILYDLGRQYGDKSDMTRDVNLEGSTAQALGQPSEDGVQRIV